MATVKKPSTRRIVIRRSAPTAKPEILSEIDSLIDSIALAEAEAHKLIKRATLDRAALLEKMQTARLTTRVSTDGRASIVRKKGNATNTIDIEAYRDMVTDEAFMNSVSITKAAATKYLGTKELESITQTTEGKLKDPELVVELK